MAKDIDSRIQTWVGESSVEVWHGETESDDGWEDEAEVDDVDAHHRSRNGLGGIWSKVNLCMIEVCCLHLLFTSSDT